MANEVTTLESAIKLGTLAVNTSLDIYDRISNAKKEISSEKKEVYLNKLNIKKLEIEQVNEQIKQIKIIEKDKLSDAEIELNESNNKKIEEYSEKIRIALNEMFDIDKEYDQYLDKKEQRHNQNVDKFVNGATKVGIGVTIGGTVLGITKIICDTIRKIKLK